MSGVRLVGGQLQGLPPMSNRCQAHCSDQPFVGDPGKWASCVCVRAAKA
jgi:hypothetical protein